MADNYESSRGKFTLALAGEAMITRALRVFREPGFLRIRELLHEADASVANAEILFHNYEDAPTNYSQTWMRCDPRYLGDLMWFGINMVSCANNHGFDYGENGVGTNIGSLEAAGITHAGSGLQYADAVSPSYLDTPGGRVALISGTTSGRINIRAGEQRRDLRGRPGVNLLRWVNEWSVDSEALESLRRVANELGWAQHIPAWWADAYGVPARDPAAVYLTDRNSLGLSSEDPAARFVLGETFGSRSLIHAEDLHRNLESVREARRMADWVVYAIHNHEGGPLSANHRALERAGLPFDREVSDPSDHVRELAHAVIDAGGDCVVGHGPHRDRGIEIYKGRPIFYSLGNFIMQNDTVVKQPQDSLSFWGLGHDNVAADMYDIRQSGRREETEPGPGWQSAIPVVGFDGGELRSVTLYPINLGFGSPRSQAGRPIIAEGEDATRALTRFQRLSEPFGTHVELEGNVGVIKV